MQTGIVWRNIWAWPLMPLFMLAAVVAGLLGRPAKRTSNDVVKYLGDALEGGEIGHDWDDFTSVPISDPALESIRIAAEMIPLPLTLQGLDTLRDLLARARALEAAQHSAP